MRRNIGLCVIGLILRDKRRMLKLQKNDYKIYVEQITRCLNLTSGFPSEFPSKIMYAYVFPIYVTSHSSLVLFYVGRSSCKVS